MKEITKELIAETVQNEISSSIERMPNIINENIDEFSKRLDDNTDKSTIEKMAMISALHSEVGNMLINILTDLLVD